MDPYSLRSEFPILSQQTYLNNCSLGALGKRTETRISEFLREWRTGGAPSWYQTWWGRLEETRKAFASIINARPDEVAILPSVSAALSVISSAIYDPENPEVVTSKLDFPTIPYQWMVKTNVDLKLVGTKDAVSVPLDEFQGAMTSRTGVLVTSHVLYTTGQIQDAKKLSAIAKKSGAVSIIDGYQSAGQLPLDVRAMGCDVFIAGGLKWLLGGPGCALLYVKRSRIAEWRPQITSWFANEHMFEFDTEKFDFRRTAARFELGTPALGSVFATLGGMETVLAASVAGIRRRQNKLVTDLYERLIDAKFKIASPELEAERAGILMVRDKDAGETVQRLAKKKIAVDYRRGKVRISPYFYNNEGENDKVVAALKSLRKA
ncbi:MAG TPA: aminotransferase class V-fold PLP-dependent enzyme [Candidatus Thermoplasmatota archaeon]